MGLRPVSYREPFERGAALVELLLVVPLFLLICSAVIDYAFVLEKRAEVRNAGRLFEAFFNSRSNLVTLPPPFTTQSVHCTSTTLPLIAQNLLEDSSSSLLDALRRHEMGEGRTLGETFRIPSPLPPLKFFFGPAGLANSSLANTITVPFELELDDKACIFCILSSLRRFELKYNGNFTIMCYERVDAEAVEPSP